jgi:hypothetical protein
MTATFLPSLAGSFRALFRVEGSAPARVDQNDPAYTTDRLGIRCNVHRRARHLDEAPLVPFAEHDMSFQAIKERSFPNSWTAVASYAATAESRGILGKTRRPRMVVVRYCDECRGEAARWMKQQESK